MKYDLSKEGYERRCYKFAHSINSSFDIFGNVYEMAGLEIDYLDEHAVCLSNALSYVYGIDCLESAIGDSPYYDFLDFVDFFNERLLTLEAGGYGLSVKDFVADMDEYLCEFRENQIIQELEEIDETSLEYKELEKEMYEISIYSLALKEIDNYCEPLETTSNYTREFMANRTHPEREERISVDMTREMWKFLCYELGKKETYALDVNNIEDLYKKIKKEDITLIMNRVRYKEKHDGEKTEKEKLYDNSIFLMQLGMMENKFLKYVLTKEEFHEEGIVELFGDKPIEEIKAYIKSKEMATKKFELEFLGYRDYYDNEDSMIEINKAIDVLESWINEETVYDDEKEYNEFYKKRNEILRYAVEKLEKVNK